MSREVLIKDLQAKGEEQIAALWREARQKAETFRAGERSRLDAERQRCELAEAEARRAVQRRRTMKARRRSQDVVILAQQELRDRLFELARTLLKGNWTGKRRSLLERLAHELPPSDWGRIEVNPEDTATAGEIFPKAEIVAEPAIGGGLIAVSRDGKVVVDNTLETRLARGWPQLEPLLLREIEKHDKAG